MESFGQKVRQAIEGVGRPLDEVAEAIGLELDQLRALERNDFSALPDDRALAPALRSLARLVGADPDEVIADYRRERQLWETRRSMLAGPAETSRRGSGRMGWLAILGSAAIALIVVVFHYWSRPPKGTLPARPAIARNETANRQPAPEPRETVEAPPIPTAPVMPEPAIEEPAGASGASIEESGVGRGVVAHELVDEDSRFAERERVWFWTRVDGGAPGESIEHVWLHEGAEAFRVRLQLGGAHWRTKSYKDLNPGSAGSWAVEARDEAGRVLARREFLCSPGR